MLSTAILHDFLFGFLLVAQQPKSNIGSSVSRFLDIYIYIYISHTHTRTYIVGLLQTTDQSVAKATTSTTHYKHKR